MRISGWSSDVCSSDLPKEGFINGRRFAHPALKFEFTVPEGFRLYNTSAAVIARGPDGAGIQFDQAPGAPSGDLVDYLANVWAKNISVGNLERIRSEEHTSELQSLLRISYAVFCLKKQTQK